MDIVNSDMSNTAVTENIAMNPLFKKWVLWAHLPHDTDWSVKSYKKIMTMSSIEDAVALYRVIPDKLVKNCMLFLMQEGVSPTWEDPKNRQGGCFSFKVPNKSVFNTWRDLSYILVGETLSNNPKVLHSITGITISPKRAFCIVKIWLSNCKVQDPGKLSEVPGLSIHGCLFKRHKPEF